MAETIDGFKIVKETRGKTEVVTLVKEKKFKKIKKTES